MSEFKFQDAVDQFTTPLDRIRTSDLTYANTIAEVCFRAEDGRDVVSIYVYKDLNFSVGGSTTVQTDTFLTYAEVYTRALAFVKTAGLKPRQL